MKTNQIRTTESRRAFTLIELLVVIIIIGILAGLLIPAIGSAMRRSKEFVVQKKVKDIEGALEQFKTKFKVYPIDFSVDPALAGGDYVIYQNLISEFVDRLGDHSYGNAGFTVLAPGASLENPYFGTIPGSPQFRNPATMTAAESLVFWLNDLSGNKEYPLGYVFDGTNWIRDPNYQSMSFYEFRDSELTDLDQDGWPELVQGSGPQLPICYFDSRTYMQLQKTVMIDADGNGAVDQTELTERLLNYIKVDESDHGQVDGGWCYPYLDFTETNKQSRFVFEEPTRFQIIAAGMDGNFGKGAGQFPGPRYSKNDDGGLIVAHRDNIVNFREGRLDNDFVTN